MTKKATVAGVLAGMAGLLFLMFLVMLLAVYAGSYNIAATEDHSPFVRWMLETTMENSVKRQAGSIEAPEFTQEMIASGAAEYKSMCEACHGGPGVDPDSWSRGLLPQPPKLHEVADEWEANEIFWLVKHGVKMTGMPAFGENHGDDELWAVAAFVTRLAEMTEEEYAQFESAHPDHHE